MSSIIRMLDSTLPEERTDGTALHKQRFLPADAECNACPLFFKIGEAVLKQEPREIPDDEDGNPFLDLASLLRIKLSVGKLASAIESEGIYTLDKYGRFGLANDADKERALNLIEIFYNWENAPLQEKAYEDTQSPLDRCDDYFHFGWASEVAPNFDSIGRKQEGPDEKEETEPPTNHKPPGHLNQDLEWQIIANEIAAQIKTATKRVPTKREVAKKLVTKLGKSFETIERRIRAKWK